MNNTMIKKAVLSLSMVTLVASPTFNYGNDEIKSSWWDYAPMGIEALRLLRNLVKISEIKHGLSEKRALEAALKKASVSPIIVTPTVLTQSVKPAPCVYVSLVEPAKVVTSVSMPKKKVQKKVASKKAPVRKKSKKVVKKAKTAVKRHRAVYRRYRNK